MFFLHMREATRLRRHRQMTNKQIIRRTTEGLETDKQNERHSDTLTDIRETTKDKLPDKRKSIELPN